MNTFNEPWRATFARFAEEEKRQFTRAIFTKVEQALHDMASQGYQLITGEDVYNLGERELRKQRAIGQGCITCYRKYCSWLSLNTDPMQSSVNRMKCANVSFYEFGNNKLIEVWGTNNVPRVGDWVQLFSNDVPRNFQVVRVFWLTKSRISIYVV